MFSNQEVDKSIYCDIKDICRASMQLEEYEERLQAWISLARGIGHEKACAAEN
jgi:hypothetical protein